MGARLFSGEPKQAGKMRPDALPLGPDELIRLRQMMRVSARVPALDSYLESAEVATMLGLHRRTVLTLAHSGAFDGPWGKAFKPSHNRLRVPKQGVQAYIDRRAVFLARKSEGAE